MISSKSFRKCVGELTKRIQKAWLGALCFGWGTVLRIPPDHCDHSLWNLVLHSSCASPLHSLQQKNKSRRCLQLARECWRHFKGIGPTANGQVRWSQPHQISEELLKSDLVELINLAKKSLWRNDHTDLGWSGRTGPGTCLPVWGWVQEQQLEESWSGTKPWIWVKCSQGTNSV